jgi:hypothetical protein
MKEKQEIVSSTLVHCVDYACKTGTNLASGSVTWYSLNEFTTAVQVFFIDPKQVRHWKKQKEWLMNIKTTCKVHQGPKSRKYPVIDKKVL